MFPPCTRCVGKLGLNRHKVMGCINCDLEGDRDVGESWFDGPEDGGVIVFPKVLQWSWEGGSYLLLLIHKLQKVAEDQNG